MKQRWPLLAALVTSFAANANPIIYDIAVAPYSGTPSDPSLFGTGQATFSENAFDADGVFDLSHGVTDFSLLLNGIHFDFSDLYFGGGDEYGVLAGELMGFDLDLRKDGAGYVFYTGTCGIQGFACPIDDAYSRFLDARPEPETDCYLLPSSLDGCRISISMTVNRTSVPEPGTLSLLSAGLIGLGLTRRRRRRA
jgi:PEP-CTERM motif